MVIPMISAAVRLSKARYVDEESNFPIAKNVTKCPGRDFFSHHIVR